MNEPITLEGLKREAFEAHDMALLDFYLALDRELTRLRAVGKIVARMWQGAGLDTDQWDALFEALGDADLLEPKGADDE